MESSKTKSSPILLLLALTFIHIPLAIAAPPVFTKLFNPDIIGPGSVSTLTFTIDNSANGTPATNLAFTDILPPGMLIAEPAFAVTTCGQGASPVFTATANGDTITLGDHSVAGGSVCTVTVDVTAPAVDDSDTDYTNTSGSLTSSEGSSGSASDILTVDVDRPGFSKAFSPAAVHPGERSRLTFTIDNSLNPNAATFASFQDFLPQGMLIADPADEFTDCGPAIVPPTVVAIPGTQLISFSSAGTLANPVVAANGSCTLAVDVIAEHPAGVLATPPHAPLINLDNSSGILSAQVSGIGITREAGKANARLTASSDPLLIAKSFTDDPVPAGGSVELAFAIANLDRNFAASDVAFTDNLNAVVPGLVFASVTSNDCGGTLSGETTTLVELSGGSIPAQGTCTIRITANVPSNTSAGQYDNTTSAVSGTVDGLTVTGNVAGDTLFVSDAPLITKEFIDDPVTGGGQVTLRFTITNTNPSHGITDIAFTDDIGGTGDGRDGALPGLAANGLVSGNSHNPLVDPCGSGSTLSVSNPFDPTLLVFSAGSLAPAGTSGDSCSFDVLLDVPTGTPSNSYTNTTSNLTATTDDGATYPSVVGAPASDDLLVVAAPTLTKEFIDDPVPPGGTATLRFTITHNPEAPADATAITFTDNLDAALGGLAATSLPSDPAVCGSGSSLSGTSSLSLSGGTLTPGESCSFDVTVTVPGGAAPGTYTNSTSTVSATVSALAVTSTAASDDLLVSGLTWSKAFTDDPVIAGADVNLRFSIANIHPTADAGGIAFSDNLANVLPGTPDLSANLTPVTNTCGGTLGGTATNLSYSGGGVTAGQSCTVDVAVTVPQGIADGSYGNTSSSLSANQGGAITLDPVADSLVIDSSQLALSKTFTDDPVAPGGNVTLEFTLTNLHTTMAASGIGFDDDLNAALSGLTFDSVGANDCGGSLSGEGTTTITVSGVGLAADASCTIRVSLSVPGNAQAGAFTNNSSAVSGSIGGLPVSGPPATDNLSVLNLLTFSKSFDGPTTATGSVTLTFNITNPGNLEANGIGFSDDLNGVLSGLVATNLPLNDACGTGSVVSGASFITLSGGSLAAAGGNCIFNVTLAVPADASAGTYPNTTSNLFQQGLKVADPATADLTIEPPPGFTKTFAPANSVVGGISTLTFTIDNSASALAASALDFTDNLPAGMTLATTPNESTTCSGGSITATSGSGVISYTGGSVAAGSVCTVQADVTTSTSGSFVNTSGDLTSSSGNSGTATDTLNTDTAPGFSKAFSPATVALNAVSTLTFTIDNSSGAVNATALSFTDTLPAGLSIANPNSASTTCNGGSITATAGGKQVSYSGGAVGAGNSCTVQVDVFAGAVGSHLNTSGDLTSSHGNSGSAGATLNVTGLGGADTDGDAIPDTVEDGAPNGGDGNGDGVPDSSQSNVASLPGANGEYVTFATPPPTTFNGMQQVAAPNLSGLDFPWGFFSFQIDGMSPPFDAIDVRVIVDTAATLGPYWKHGPEPGNLAEHAYEFLFDGTTGARPPVGNEYLIRFVDALRGDDVFTINANLMDDGGPSVRIAGVPLIGPWTLALLAGLLALGGTLRLRGKRR